MTTSTILLLLVTLVIWGACVFLGIVVSKGLGKILGTLLGWMVATSLDLHIGRGGEVGRTMGDKAGLGIGIALGGYGALQLTILAAQRIMGG